ncbi:DUF2807 domain-containing protein [Halosquirtibacter xylanolyticus]|uniref:head GIN domain-containing protein n=1 Tax=Halosquirtibacter xylanolyticus TaxID=3374599 RepID=UPI00374791D9|nr:DUF2807 domain-containing protein [Prolixibacteraceae bacterium]
MYWNEKMNRLLFLTVIFTILCSFQHDSFAMKVQRSEKGNGIVTREARDIDNFTRIHVATAIFAKVRSGDQFEVVVETDENLQDNITTKVQGGELRIFVSKSIKRSSKMNVYITLPRLEGAKTTSSGTIEGVGNFVCDNFYAEASSAGNVRINVDAKRIDARVSSGGDVELEGKANELYVSASSGGDFDSPKLNALVAKVRASSGADITLTVLNAFIGSASSGGKIDYYGTPKKVDVSSSSGGDVDHKR